MLLIKTFLLLSAVLHFMRIRIAPGKAHAQVNWVAMVSLESLPITFKDRLFLMVNGVREFYSLVFEH